MAGTYSGGGGNGGTCYPQEYGKKRGKCVKIGKIGQNKTYFPNCGPICSLGGGQNYKIQ